MLQKSHSTWLQNDRILEFSPISPKVREFRDFRDFGKPNRCQKAQISSKWSLPPPHKFYMFNNTIGCDSVPIFSMIGAGPVLTFEKHRLPQVVTVFRLTKESFAIFARSALSIRAVHLILMFVRPSVLRSPRDNWFLSRVSEGGFIATVYWYFELLIFKDPEVNRSQKS